jgi:CRP/FNR family transcriptional regulator, polysaccharide utilization system transcription regulator
MVSDEPANLSEVALEDMEVCFIPKSEILGFFNKNNQFSLGLMKSVCGDLKESDLHVVSMAQKTVKNRLAETLLYLQDSFGKNTDICCSLKIGQKIEQI